MQAVTHPYRNTVFIVPRREFDDELTPSFFFRIIEWPETTDHFDTVFGRNFPIPRHFGTRLLAHYINPRYNCYFKTFRHICTVCWRRKVKEPTTARLRGQYVRHNDSRRRQRSPWQAISCSLTSPTVPF